MKNLNFKKWLQMVETGTIAGYIAPLLMPVGSTTGNAFISGDSQELFNQCGPTMCGGRKSSRKKHFKNNR